MPISFFPNRGLLKNYFDIGYWGSVLAGRTTPAVLEVAGAGPATIRSMAGAPALRSMAGTPIIRQV